MSAAGEGTDVAVRVERASTRSFMERVRPPQARFVGLTSLV